MREGDTVIYTQSSTKGQRDNGELRYIDYNQGSRERERESYPYLRQ